MCGRVIGYQIGSPNSFASDQYNKRLTIDQAYVDGINITNGNPRTHIWSYAGGPTEVGNCSLNDIMKAHAALVPILHLGLL